MQCATTTITIATQTTIDDHVVVATAAVASRARAARIGGESRAAVGGLQARANKKIGAKKTAPEVFCGARAETSRRRAATRASRSNFTSRFRARNRRCLCSCRHVRASAFCTRARAFSLQKRRCLKSNTTTTSVVTTRQLSSSTASIAKAATTSGGVVKRHFVVVGRVSARRPSGREPKSPSTLPPP